MNEDCNMFVLGLHTEMNIYLCCSKKVRNIKALKSLLVARSSVFEKMFCGELPETQDVIDVTDIEPQVFYEMLRYDMIITTIFCYTVKFFPGVFKS